MELEIKKNENVTVTEEKKCVRDGDMMGGGRKGKQISPDILKSWLYKEGISSRDGNIGKGIGETHFELHCVTE